MVQALLASDHKNSFARKAALPYLYPAVTQRYPCWSAQVSPVSKGKCCKSKPYPISPRSSAVKNKQAKKQNHHQQQKCSAQSMGANPEGRGDGEKALYQLSPKAAQETAAVVSTGVSYTPNSQALAELHDRSLCHTAPGKHHSSCSALSHSSVCCIFLLWWEFIPFKIGSFPKG